MVLVDKVVKIKTETIKVATPAQVSEQEEAPKKANRKNKED